MPAEEACGLTCALAAVLQDREAVWAWVAVSFPLVLVDEAQDLSAERSGLVATLTQSGTVPMSAGLIHPLAFSNLGDPFRHLDLHILHSAVQAASDHRIDLGDVEYNTGHDSEFREFPDRVCIGR